ncbi:MAG: tetratricopeptide repeat protein, partial [Paramuribaculum sp.]|nr:tetratricopeptide repeat protein [Paramuribaculum sp.]
IICLLTLTGCSYSRHDSRLSSIAAIVSDYPEEAIRALDSIDRNTLAEDDRHYYDFLTIKARDKAYISHTSDSLYLTVLDYYSQHTDDELYPEVLYYGGRVYNNIKEYDTSLSFYHKALDILPTSAASSNKDLKARILCQTGVLFYCLGLYKEAIQYVKEAINIRQEINDKKAEFLDLLFLGDIYLNTEDYLEAQDCFRLAYYKSENLKPELRADARLYLGAAKVWLDEGDSAVIYLRNTPKTVSKNLRNEALIYAACIYYNTGMLDSAYHCVSEIIHNKSNSNKLNAYDYLLTTELRDMIPADSVPIYMADYLDRLKSSFDTNKNQLAINQQALHTYLFHEKLRVKAEKRKKFLTWLLTATILIAFSLAITALILKLRSHRNFIRLQAVLENITRLKQQLDKHRENIIDLQIPEINNSELELREKLKTQLLDIYNNSPKSYELPPEIAQHDAYIKLRELIAEEKSLIDTNPLWDELQDMILSISPDFINNLRLLTGGKLSSSDLNTAILIKCGVKPTQMTKLLNRSKGAIVSRRESLCLRIFNEKLGTKVIDGIIRLL